MLVHQNVQRFLDSGTELEPEPGFCLSEGTQRKMFIQINNLKAWQWFLNLHLSYLTHISFNNKDCLT